MKTDKIFFGAAYYDEYMPYDRIDKDMEMMKKAGMNTIRIAESTWSTWEPHDGEFDFTHLNRMLDAAEKYGINVIVGTPTYAVPTWLVKKYPDIPAVTHAGQELYGRRQNMDITHEGYLFHAERIIRKLLEQTAHRDCVIGFQVDNETTANDVCTPRAQKAFVEYLKNEFPDIDEFNREFGLDYWSNRINSWEDFPDIRGTINGSLSAEYAKFQRKLVTDFFNRQIDIINEYRRPEQFITHNFDYYWTGVSAGMKPAVNQFDAAANLTVAGTDIYHPAAASLTGMEIAFGGSLMRGLKGSNYLVLETQAQGNMGWLPYPGQLRLQAYSHIASGANSVMYWHWHSIHNAIESYWKGVLSHNLKENATYLEACIIGKEFSRIGHRINNLEKHCYIAVMVDNESLTGLDEFPINKDFRYNDILRWIFTALYNRNFECDFISQNVSFSKLSSYKAVIVPAMYSASDEVLLKLKKYVKDGGHLIMTFKSAFCDRHLKIRWDDQPYLLTDVFGMTYDSFTCDDVTLKNTSFGGDGIKVTNFMELLIPDTASVLAEYDNPAYINYAAVTSNRYGLGSATYIGCHFDGHILENLLCNILEDAKVVSPDTNFPLIIREGINSYGKKIVFYLNYSPDSLTVEIPYDGEELITGKPVTGGENHTLLPWNLMILEVSK
ncbi:MAG: beta-galactosidase [Butyrivibrio sp.]